MDKLLFKPETKLELYKLRNPDETKEPNDASLDESAAGCTATVALIVSDQIIVANAGDSRTMVGCSGECFPLTIDHKPDDELEKNRIMAADGYVMDGRVNSNLNLSRAIG